MAETRIKLSHVLILVVKPTSKTVAKSIHRNKASLLQLLTVVRGHPFLVAKLATAMHAAAPTDEDLVISQVADGVLHQQLALELDITPPRQTKIKMRTLWDNYPKETLYPTDANARVSIWNLVGGKVLYNATHQDPAKPGHMIFENSCATRMSRTFNRSGLKIPYINGQTSSGGDHTWHIYRVDHFRPEVVKLFGAATVLDNATWKSEIEDQPGIVLFTSSFTDATGHVALWNGSEFVNGYADEHDGRPEVLKKVEFWEVSW